MSTKITEDDAAEIARLRAKLAPIEAAARAYHAACETSARAPSSEQRDAALFRDRAFAALGNAGYALLDDAPRCACGCAPCRGGRHAEHDADTGTALCPAGQAAEDGWRASIRAVGHCEAPGCNDGPACACPCEDCREAVAALR